MRILVLMASLMALMANPATYVQLGQSIASGAGQVLKSDSGEIKIVVLAILAIVIAAILWSSLGPTSINQLESNRNASWRSGTLAIYDNTSIFYALAGMIIPAVIVIRMFD